jgi:PBSX family phage terminase large subunit
MKTKEQKVKYKPLPKQYAFHQSRAQISAYFGGLGSGKTFAGAHKSLEYMIDYPGSTGWIGANTYKVLKRATMRTFFEILPPDLIHRFNRSELELELTNGSTAFFGSTEKPDNLRGPNLNWWWLDEVNSSSKAAYLNMLGRLRVGEPRAWCTGTAKGFNWTYDEFADPRKKKEGRWFIISSTRENKHLPPGYVKMLEESYHGAFAKQEIEGEFVGFEGMVYASFNYQDHVKDMFPVELKAMPAFVGVDFGYTNPSAMVLFTLDNDDRVWVHEEFYEREVFVEELVRKLEEWKQMGYDIQGIYCDPSQPGSIQKIRDAGFNAYDADNSVFDGIREVSNKIAKRADGKPGLFVREPSCPNLLVEFMNYRYQESEDGKPMQEKPVKMFDHAMDALRYGIMGTLHGEKVGYVDVGY